MSALSMTRAFFDLCKEEQIVSKISEHFDDFNMVIDASDAWVSLMDSPMLSFDKKKKMIDELTYDVRFLSFLKLLAKNRMMHTFTHVYQEWLNQNRLLHQIAYIRVYTAKKLSKEQEEALVQVLQKRFTDKKVSLKVTVDEKLIGGIVTVYKGQSLDISVSRELEELFTTI